MTYFLVRLFGGSNGEKVGRYEVDSLQWWTGAVLTFSVSLMHVRDVLYCIFNRGRVHVLQGGTFLYVATVISPLSDADGHNTHAHAHTHDPEDEKLSKPARLGLLVMGMVLPLILSAVLGGHSH